METIKTYYKKQIDKMKKIKFEKEIENELNLGSQKREDAYIKIIDPEDD